MGKKREVSCSHFPGAAFDKISVSGWFDIDLDDMDDMTMEAETEYSTASDSSSTDSSTSSSNNPYADMEDDEVSEPSSGLCKALDAALFITRKHGEPLQCGY
jgi:hypothetical protein